MARVSVRNGLRLGALLALGLALAVVSTVEATPRPGARRVLNLFSGFLGRQNVNRFDCGLDAVGQVCVDPAGSTTVGGGFWPKGTPDQYVFNSGLQLAGIVDPSLTGFGWASDTVGAFFFDPKGTTQHGDRLSLVWNSIDASDNANWPRDAYVPNDPSLYNAVLIGLKAASQQDTWARYWDGNPKNNAGRKHPLGVLVDQRGMAWNFPTGNEDIIYYLYTFTNITASDAAVYAGRPDADSLTLYGARFQALNEAAFGDTIPNGGFTIKEMYAAFAMDADVSDAARENYSTAFLPFSMGTAFKRNWFAPSMLFPSTIFSAPFAQAPGIVGVKYLKSPVVAGQEVGLTMFSNTINGGQFDDAQNTTQLWRYLSAKLNPSAGDAPCNNPGVPLTTKVCFVTQSSDDVRFFQSSGPMDLAPGESKTIVVAYIAAAPVNVPQIAGRSQAFDLKPGFPAQPAGMATGNPADSLRSVDRVFGAISIVGDTGGALGGGPNGKIDQNEVRTVPRSLLNKGLVAQAVFDAKFLLPFPPASPQFFLVPGDNQVTIVWQQSATETDAIGDPYFDVASDSASVLFDPNYRQRDVEGYRVYRGRTSGALELVAQFDYAGRQITDFTAAFQYGNCAPELGLTAECPAGYNTTGITQDLVGEVVQVPPGGRVSTLPDTNVLVLQADTAVVGGGAEGGCRPSRCPPLEDTGIPFAFVDHGVKNSFTYFYAVTAFDVNSVRSVGVGNTALESPRVTKTVVPRKPSTNITTTELTQSVQGSGGAVLNPAALFPTIDPANGTFNGIIPPANDGELLMSSAVVEALPGGDITVRLDSISAGFTGGIGVAPNAYFTLEAGGSTIQKTVPIPQPNFNATTNPTYSFSEPLIPYDSGAARRFGIQFTQDVRMPVAFEAATIPVYRTSGAIAVTAGRFGVGSTASLYLAHSRWWDASAAEPADPTVRSGPDSSRNSGDLSGVGRIWAPQAYRDANVNLNFRGYSYAQTAWYPADFLVTWNADSSLTVRDSTHRLTLAFAPNGGAGWGFVNLRSLIAAGVTGSTNPATDVADGTGSPSMAAIAYQHVYGTQPTCFPDWWVIPCALLERTAQYQALDFNSDGAGDANGIALMINGEFFMMEMVAIPAAGTSWRFRAVTGDMEATCTPAFGTATDCSDYEFTPAPVRPSRATGLSYKATVVQQYAVDSTRTGDLANVHTVPDPYYVTNSLEQSPNSKKLRFVNLPSRAIVRIYSLSGVLVQILTLNDQTGGGELEWNLRNRNNQFVASGVYFYHVEGPDGKSKVGRFTVVNFAQ
ncbi:MAG: hypothetical protein ACREMI_12940 [Gemmatimonadales bacterium]